MPTSEAGSNKFISRGFSLIELLVVLTILTGATLAIASAMPYFRHTSIIDSSAKEIAGVMRKTRMLSISRASTVILSVDKASRRYWIHGDRKTYSIPASLELVWHPQESVLNILFYPDGSASRPGLSLSDGQRLIEVSLSPLTGHVALRH